MPIRLHYAEQKSSRSRREPYPALRDLANRPRPLAGDVLDAEPLALDEGSGSLNGHADHRQDWELIDTLAESTEPET